jgi:hypothetical protein
VICVSVPPVNFFSVVADGPPSPYINFRFTGETDGYWWVGFTRKLVSWAEVMMTLDYTLDNAWTVVDLFRASVAIEEVNRWFVENGLHCIKHILDSVSANASRPWKLHFVTVRLVSHGLAQW